MSFSLQDVAVRHVSDARDALRGITLDVVQGEQVALVGPSGAGKTTLLHTLACAHRPSGTLRAFGSDPWLLSSSERHLLRRRLCLAPQTPPLPPRQRVITAVLAGRLPQMSTARALLSLFKPEDPQAAFDALSRVGLQDKLYHRVDRLSGGERQRCSIARLLISDAQAFLVDEPLSALDPALATQTLSVIQREATERNATLICSLHQVELARSAFPRLIGLRDGRVFFDLPRAQVSDSLVAALYAHAPASCTNTEMDTDVTPDTSDRPLAARCF